jgi:hypothetical protein
MDEIVMRSKKAFIWILLGVLVLSLVSINVLAQEKNDDDSLSKGDYQVFGFQLEKFIAMVNAWISVFLFVIAFVAYRRDGRKRLFYVSLAFLLFAIKSFLIGFEIFFNVPDWFDPTATVLEFGVLLSFFYGVLKK